MMASDTELKSMNAELERLKGALARKDAKIQAPKTKLQNVAEWEATFDALSDPVFIHDKQFKIVRANRAYIEAAGITPDKMIGKLYYEVFPRLDGPFKMCL